jgi:hypothetical protein
MRKTVRLSAYLSHSISFKFDSVVKFNMVVSRKMGNGGELLLYAWEEYSLFGEVETNAAL